MGSVKIMPLFVGNKATKKGLLQNTWVTRWVGMSGSLRAMRCSRFVD